jgi:hypothetical protein
MVQSQPGQIVLETLSWKNPSHKKKEWWSGSRCRPQVQTPVLKKKKMYLGVRFILWFHLLKSLSFMLPPTEKWDSLIYNFLKIKFDFFSLSFHTFLPSMYAFPFWEPGQGKNWAKAATKQCFLRFISPTLWELWFSYILLKSI